MSDDKNKFFDQVKEMSKGLQGLQKQVQSTVYNGESGAGMVKLSINGAFTVLSTELSDDFAKQPKELQQELIKGALQNALDKLMDSSNTKFSDLFGNMGDILGGK
jgi:DNA-binding YbaB/EbfC family protein